MHGTVVSPELLPRRLTHTNGTGSRRGRCQFRVCSNLANLQSWQVAKLQDAYVKGRKKFKVMQLCESVELPRAAVLEWMKEFDALDESTRRNILETRSASQTAAEERRDILSQAKQKVEEDDITAHWRSYMSPRARVAERMRSKPLSKSAEATLEKVYESIRYPDESVIRDIFELHKVPRERVLKWFHKKRDADASRKKAAMMKKQRQQSDVSSLSRDDDFESSDEFQQRSA